MFFEPKSDDLSVVPFAAQNLEELRQQLQESRQQQVAQLSKNLASIRQQNFQFQEEECFLSLRLQTAIGSDFAGQFVEENGELVYLSLFAKSDYLP